MWFARRVDVENTTRFRRAGTPPACWHLSVVYYSIVHFIRGCGCAQPPANRLDNSGVSRVILVLYVPWALYVL